MGDEDDGFPPFAVQLVEKIHHGAAGLGVQRAGRLVGEQQRGITGHCPGDRNPLFLSAGQLVGLVLGAIPHPHHLQQFPRPRGPPAGGNTGIEQRQLDVLLCVGAADQVEGLKDKADLPVADCRELAVAGPLDIHPVQQVAAAGGPVQRPDDIHNGGFAAA